MILRCDIVIKVLSSILIAYVAQAAPGVLSVSPSSQSLTAARNSPVTISFNVPLDPTSVNASTVSLFGRWTGVVTGSLTLEENNTRIRFIPSTLFAAGDMILVTVSKGIRDQSGSNMVNGYSWQFWIQTLPGNINLTEIGRVNIRRPGEGRIQAYGAHGCDLNKDGFSDFFVPNEITNDCRVFLNNGQGGYSSFAVHPIPSGSRPSTNDCADFNMDGNPDVAVGNSTGDSVTIFLGDGLGGFLSVRNYRAAGGIRGLSVGDLNGDGYADIVTANRSGNNIAVLLNNGDGTFAPRALIEANGSAETACALADANGDGILDLFVGAYASSEIILLLGNGTGGFTFSSKVAAGGNGPWMIAVGDMNGDGKVDVVSANSSSNNCSIVFGDGLGGLSAAVAYPTGGFPIAIDVGDIDGDGDLDLVTSNYSGRNWSVFENTGNGVLVSRGTLPAAIAGSCATLHDRDNDGDLDMTGIDEEADLIFLFENSPAVSVHESPSRPSGFALLSNYPNPFNPETEIVFDVPIAASVNITVYDLRGSQIKALLNESRSAGRYSVRWNGRSDSGTEVAGGIYLCAMTAKSMDLPAFSAVTKLVLVR